MEASGAWFVIINPTSGNNKSIKKWPKIQTLLKQNDIAFKPEFTKHDKDYEPLVIKAIKKGYRKILCIGGDGTVHGVVNGIMHQKIVDSNTITVGLIPIGTGNDWARTYAIPSNLEQAILIIKKGVTKTQDVGKIDFLDIKKPCLYFNNMAGMGFDAFVANGIKPLKKFGSLAYLIGGLKGILFFKNFDVSITTNNEVINTKAFMVLAGICTYSGGGMRLTDSPNVNDGYLDVSLYNSISKLDIIKHLKSLYNGNIKRINKVKTLKTKKLEIKNSDSSQKLIQSDGEVTASGHVKISIIPNALSFKIKA